MILVSLMVKTGYLGWNFENGLPDVLFQVMGLIWLLWFRAQKLISKISYYTNKDEIRE